MRASRTPCRTQMFAAIGGILASVLLTASGMAQTFNFISIDAPCSACAGGIASSTTAFGINPEGDIVGTWTDSGGMSHGFLFSGGQFTTIDVPGSIVDATGTLSTIARGISPTGEIVGSFTAPVSSAPSNSPSYCPATGSTYCIKGFLFSHGVFSLVLFPGHMGAIAQRISPTGDIFGCLHDYNMSTTMYGFGITRLGDTSLQLDGGELADSALSLPNSMENGAAQNGSLRAGLYIDNSGFQHGYIVQNGIVRPYNVPGPLQTTIWDMNPFGDFVGIYIDSRGFQQGFLQPADGSAPISLTFPGAVRTRAYGITPDLVIVGGYIDTSGHSHGFLAVPQQDN